MKSLYFSKIILIAITISSLIQVFSALIQPDTHSQKKDLIVRQIIHERISNLIQHRSVLEMSANFENDSGNNLLKRCLTKSLTCTPKIQAVPFAIVKNIAPPFEFLSGTRENPALYSTDGSMSCDANCEGWEVRSYFSIRCSDGADSCESPNSSKSLNIFFQILPTPTNLKGIELGPRPPQIQFEDYTTADATFVIDGKTRMERDQ